MSVVIRRPPGGADASNNDRWRLVGPPAPVRSLRARRLLRRRRHSRTAVLEATGHPSSGVTSLASWFWELLDQDYYDGPELADRSRPVDQTVPGPRAVPADWQRHVTTDDRRHRPGAALPRSALHFSTYALRRAIRFAAVAVPVVRDRFRSHRRRASRAFNSWVVPLLPS